MINASFRIELPRDSWIREVSQSFPNATFRLLAGVRTGETAVELGEVIADDPRAASAAVAAHPAILDHERLEVTDERSLSKYETADTGLYAFIEQASLPPEFPVVVRNGWYELDFTGSREAFDDLRAGLERADRRFELRSLVDTDGAEALLTERQREVLEVALRKGYFEVPRECTLADIATELDVDPSTASGVVRRGQARILKWFLTDTRELDPAP